jgi:small subunit ribosomal protein S20
MPQKKSAEKALRQIKRKTERNDNVRRNLDYLYRQFKKALNSNDKEKMQKIAKDLSKSLDKAAQKNVIHKNAAGRKKSRLMKKVNKK